MPGRPDRGPRRAAFAAALAVLAAGGCGGVDRDGIVSLPAVSLGRAPEAPAAAPGPVVALRRIADSIWAVAPGAPSGRVRAPPELVEGSAVAVSPRALLASCDVVGGQEQVRVARRSSHRVARGAGADAGRRVCALEPADADLRPVEAYRRYDDLRVGEPVLAVASRSSRDFALARGWLVAKGGSADPFLETTLVLPPEARSVVLFDGFGNLVGLGSAGPASESVVLAAPVPASLAPGLAPAELGDSPALLASLAPEPAAPPRPVTTVFPLEEAGAPPEPVDGDGATR
jgi:hypothetical protein